MRLYSELSTNAILSGAINKIQVESTVELVQPIPIPMPMDSDVCT